VPSASEKVAGKQKESKVTDLELQKTVDRPVLPGNDGGSSFRAVRYHPHDPKVLYTVINTVPSRSQKKNAPRRAFVCKWNAENWTVTRPRQVSDRSLTCFDIRYAANTGAGLFYSHRHEQRGRKVYRVRLIRLHSRCTGWEHTRSQFLS
jgi:hypothetical protein